jgi:hypothetical protein
MKIPSYEMRVLIMNCRLNEQSLSTTSPSCDLHGLTVKEAIALLDAKLHVWLSYSLKSKSKHPFKVITGFAFYVSL